MQKDFEPHLRNALFPAFIVLFLMWFFYWSDFVFQYDFHQLGVLPKTWSHIWGIFTMPLIHSHQDFKHILNNSIPFFLLTTLLFYSYRKIALKVFVFSWIMTGLGVWLFAKNNGAVHIGMSGMIYALAGFLFTSGVIRQYLPLQALSMFIIFMYGSLIWGIFPTNQHISWEGHLSGLVSGVFLAFIWKQKGPQRPKYQYEIEKEMGIEPPDLEGMYWERVRELEALEQMKAEAEVQEQQPVQQIIYHYVPKESLKTNPLQDVPEIQPEPNPDSNNLNSQKENEAQ